MNYPHLTRILSAKFPKLKIDEGTEDLDKIGVIIIDGKLMTIEEFQSSKNLKVNGYVHLYDNKEITSLPEGLEVKWSLDIFGTNITSLPEGLKVGGELVLGNKISSLPKGLKVGGNLHLNSKITSLPDDLEVDGVIFAWGSQKIKCSPKLKRKLRKAREA